MRQGREKKITTDEKVKDPKNLELCKGSSQILRPSRIVTRGKETDLFAAGFLKKEKSHMWHTKREKHTLPFSQNTQ